MRQAIRRDDYRPFVIDMGHRVEVVPFDAGVSDVSRDKRENVIGLWASFIANPPIPMTPAVA